MERAKTTIRPRRHDEGIFNGINTLRWPNVGQLSVMLTKHYTNIRVNGWCLHLTRLWSITSRDSMGIIIVITHWTRDVYLTPHISVPAGNYDRWITTQQTQNICITLVQCWTNVEDVGPTLYKCYTNIFGFAGKRPVAFANFHVIDSWMELLACQITYSVLILIYWIFQ